MLFYVHILISYYKQSRSIFIISRYPVALAAVSSGAIDLKSFITHHFPLEKSKEALEYAATGEAMKIIIHL